MTDWRNELIKDVTNAMYKVENMPCSKLLVMTRAALAVAEPVIREQTGGKLRAENAQLRESLLIAELMASEMGIDPREKCQKIYEYLHDIREGGND